MPDLSFNSTFGLRGMFLSGRVNQRSHTVSVSSNWILLGYPGHNFIVESNTWILVRFQHACPCSSGVFCVIPLLFSELDTWIQSGFSAPVCVNVRVTPAKMSTWALYCYLILDILFSDSRVYGFANIVMTLLLARLWLRSAGSKWPYLGNPLWGFLIALKSKLGCDMLFQCGSYL